MEKFYRIGFWCFFIANLLVSGVFMFDNFNTKTVTAQTQTEMNISNYTQCRGLNLTEAAYCMRDFVKGFYNYTISPDEPRNLTDIMSNGGDCYDYGNLYMNMAEDLGFKGYTFIIEMNNENKHLFAVVSDETGYCKLDNLNVNCVLYDYGKMSALRE